MDIGSSRCSAHADECSMRAAGGAEVRDQRGVTYLDVAGDYVEAQISSSAAGTVDRSCWARAHCEITGLGPMQANLQGMDARGLIGPWRCRARRRRRIDVHRAVGHHLRRCWTRDRRPRHGASKGSMPSRRRDLRWVIGASAGTGYTRLASGGDHG